MTLDPASPRAHHTVVEPPVELLVPESVTLDPASLRAHMAVWSDEEPVCIAKCARSKTEECLGHLCSVQTQESEDGLVGDVDFLKEEGQVCDSEIIQLQYNQVEKTEKFTEI